MRHENLPFILTAMFALLVSSCGSKMLRSAQNQDWESVRNLVESGKDVNQLSGRDKLSVLHIAAREGNNEMVQYLIAKGADVNAMGAVKSTPLFLAVWNGHTQTVNILLDNGADMYAQTMFNESIMDVAFKKDRKKIMWMMLLERGYDVNTTRVGLFIVKAVMYNNKDAVNFAIMKGADVNNPPLLDYAGNFEMLKFLESLGADIHRVDEEGNTLLHNMCRKGDLDAVKYLESKGMDVHLKTKWGFTTLMGAAESGNQEMVDYLIEKGVEVEAKTKGWEYTALMYAAEQMQSGVAKSLIAAGANVNAVATNKITPLIIAAGTGYYTVGTVLIDAGADVNWEGGQFNQPPLMYCIGQDDILLQKMIDAGANVNWAKKNGIRPLDHAQDMGYPSAAKILIKAGAKRGTPKK